MNTDEPQQLSELVAQVRAASARRVHAQIFVMGVLILPVRFVTEPAWLNSGLWVFSGACGLAALVLVIRYF